jgi:hypothetical protein
VSRQKLIWLPTTRIPNNSSDLWAQIRMSVSPSGQDGFLHGIYLLEFSTILAL